MSDQPVWSLIANLGDENPLDYGGYFIFKDETGVYTEEAELLELDDPDSENTTYTVYRFILDKCTFNDGILSNNEYHPDFPAWFAHPESEKAKRPQDSTYLSCVADCMGYTLEYLRNAFCSEDPCDRAMAYRAIGEYHGFINLDQYPLNLTCEEAKERYKRIAQRKR